MTTPRPTDAQAAPEKPTFPAKLAELAAYYRCSESTLSRHANTGVLKAVWVGGWRVSAGAWAAYCKRKRAVGRPKKVASADGLSELAKKYGYK